MARLRIIIGNKIPTDHLMDVENLPLSFLAPLEKQPKQNWVHPEKPEYNVEFKSNQWEDLQVLIKRHCSDVRIPEPACLVQTDDADRARILPPNLKDADVPKVVLNLEPEKETAPKVIKPTFVCPNCDFEGKAQLDVEAHLQEKHGEDPSVRSLAGKSVGNPVGGGIVQTKYACVSCDYETPVKSELITHSVTHLQAKNEPPTVSRETALCGIDGCEFNTNNPMSMRGHRMGAHRKKAVAA